MPKPRARARFVSLAVLGAMWACGPGSIGPERTERAASGQELAASSDMRNTVASTTGTPVFSSRESASNGPRLVIVPDTMATAVALDSTADAYVQDGASAATNFGATSSLLVKKSQSPGDGTTREAYLKFELSAVGGITGGKLRLYGSSVGTAGVVTEVVSSTVASWGETALTWNNKPAQGAAPGTSLTLSTTEAWHEWDVTSFLQAEKAAGRNVVTLVLRNLAWSAGSPPSFRSREAAANRPQLLITTASGADTAAPTASLSAPANGATVRNGVAVTATASDNVGVVGVQFKLDDKNLGAEDTTAPYGLTWDTLSVSNGVHQLTVVARDAAGNTTTSAPVSVMVDNRPARGAVIPWTYYEAEEGVRHPGAELQTGARLGDVAFEARGKKSVVLKANGQYIEWTNVVAASHVTVRYSIPEGASGSLSLYVNGTLRAKLPLSSVRMRESKPVDQVPGGIVRFFDDVMVAVDIPANATVRLQRDSGTIDSTIDFLELEMAPPPLTKPDDTWVSVNGNDRTAIVNAFNLASGTGGSKKVWFPPGVYNVSSSIPVPSGLQIRGAGMWHTIIHKNFTGANARMFVIAGTNNSVRDLKVVDSMTQLSGNSGNALFEVRGSTNCVLENIWSEYGTLALAYHASGLTVRHCRVRNGYKDAIHLASSAHDSLIENTTFRNVGDDCAAFVSYGSTELRNNTARYNTIELVYWGRAISLQGGNGMLVEHNVVNDCSMAGILVAIDGWGDPFVYWPFNTNFVVQHNTVSRCGNHINAAYGGSIAIWGRATNPMSGRMEYNEVLEPPHHSAQITGNVGDASHTVYFRYNRLDAPGGTGQREYISLNAGSNVVHEPSTGF